MQWKTVVKTKDVVSFQKKSKEYTVILEARRSEGEAWNIIKRYFNKKDINYTEEFTTKSDENLLFLLSKLKDSNYTIDELKNLEVLKLNEIKLNPNRKYKEYNLEKWVFGVNDEGEQNSIIIRYNDTIEIDLYLFERYKCVEEKVIEALKGTFGLDDFDFDLQFTVYYFSSRHQKSESLKRDLNQLLDAIEVDESNDGEC